MLTIIAVKDNAMQTFQHIATVRAKGEALRNFKDLINNPSNAQLHQHADDFDLYELGTFNDETGEITAKTPELLMRGKDVKAMAGINMTLSR